MLRKKTAHNFLGKVGGSCHFSQISWQFRPLLRTFLSELSSTLILPPNPIFLSVFLIGNLTRYRLPHNIKTDTPRSLHCARSIPISTSTILHTYVLTYSIQTVFETDNTVIKSIKPHKLSLRSSCNVIVRTDICTVYNILTFTKF